MLKFLQNLFDENRRRLVTYKPIIDRINAFSDEFENISDQELFAKTPYFKELLLTGKTLDDILPEAYAVAREAIRRTIGEKAHEVQLVSAITLHQGAISEQKTGEGKTHSVIFPAYLNALSGLGVHIITPNDYLTRVGAGWYPQALKKIGISTACIIHEQSFLLDPDYTDETEKFDDRLSHLKPISRKEAYQADITYGTNNEFGFDYLRDHMVSDFSEMVQRPYHNFAVVDEVDFVLIDEARTPLIISSPNNSPVEKYYQFAKVAAQLQSSDYVIDEKARSATLSEYGIRKVERIMNVGNLYEESFESIHYIENAIKAVALFHKDKDYVVKDGEVIIVDEFTGRLMNGRRWSDGLHQAVEAKENVQVQRESQTWATITFQNYFRLYKKLAGMTGTASTEAEEFKKIYDLDVVPIPTHRPVQRIDAHDFIYKNQKSKYNAIAAKVEEIYKTGQPVLIGTTSIEKNEVIASLLRKKGIPCQVLNAKNHKTEAEVISKAGKIGAVTVATNMAGRGVDIILGGPKDGVDKTTWKKEHDEVISLGGLYVIGTERHESRRIDNQLRGRSGRQGDPGASNFFVALDDDLMRIFDGEKISTLMTRFNMPEDVPLTHSMISRVVEQIQVKVEGYNFDVRKNLVEYDDVINKQRRIIYTLRDQSLINAKNNPEALKTDIFKYLKNEIDNIVSINTDPSLGKNDIEKIALEFSEVIPMNSESRSKIKEDLEKAESTTDYLMQLISDEWDKRISYFGQDLSNNVLTFAIISTIDPLWVDHLTGLDDLRDGVRLRGFAQKDPLIEYRKEGYEMFQQLMRQFEYNLSRKLFRLEPVLAKEQIVKPQNATETRGEVQNLQQPQNQQIPQEKDVDISDLPELQKPISKDTIGRNDNCPCGSGKKYKKCCYPKFG